jgi:hypothetical protein
MDAHYCKSLLKKWLVKLIIDRTDVQEGLLSLLSNLPNLLSGSERISDLSQRDLEIKRLIDKSFLKQLKTVDKHEQKKYQKNRFEISITL